MSKRAIEAAKRAFPFRAATAKLYDGQTVTFDGNEAKREIFQRGYEQAEKDFALTWQDVSILITIYEAGIENGDYRRYNDAEWMKEYSQDILRRFNEIRKK